MEATQNAGGAAAAPTVQSLRGNAIAPREQHLPSVEPGFNSLQGFELLMRQSKALAASTLVPPQYRAVIVKTNWKGEVTSQVENANAIPNCMIALNMATRMHADPLMVMQNLVVVEGKPSWSSQWVIAQINNCGRFEPLQFDIAEVGSEEVEYEYTEWGEARGEKKRVKKTIRIENIECRAWTVKKGVVIPPGVNSIADAMALKLPILKGPKVSVAMAVKEGWYQKTGSKWQTMPELMLHYRSGAFFGRLYAPELLMGIPSEDEVRDMGTLVQGADGAFTPPPAGQEDPLSPSIDALKRSAAAHADVQDAEPRQATAEGGPSTPAPGPQAAEKTAAGESTQATAQPEQQNATSPAATPAQASQQPAAATGGDSLFGNTD